MTGRVGLTNSCKVIVTGSGLSVTVMVAGRQVGSLLRIVRYVRRLG